MFKNNGYIHVCSSGTEPDTPGAKLIKNKFLSIWSFNDLVVHVSDTMMREVLNSWLKLNDCLWLYPPWLNKWFSLALA